MLYDGATCCVYFNLVNAASFTFDVSTVNLGNNLGGIILGGGWGFWCLGYDCFFGLSSLEYRLSTLGDGLVFFFNGGDGWDAVCF